MVRIILAAALGAALAATPAVAEPVAGTQRVSPAVPGYGDILTYSGAALMPAPSAVHKIVFDVTADKTNGKGINSALDHVARAVNAYEFAGVDKAHRQFVAVIHGGATNTILNEAAYKAKFGKANPDNELISRLLEAGVTFYVCGQALADSDYAVKDVNPKVGVTLSALIAVPELEAKGYSLVKM